MADTRDELMQMRAKMQRTAPIKKAAREEARTWAVVMVIFVIWLGVKVIA